MAHGLNFIRGSLCGALIAAAVVLMPMIGVKRGLNGALAHWQEYSTICVLLAASGVIGGAICGADPQVRSMLLGGNLALASQFAIASSTGDDGETGATRKRKMWQRISRHWSACTATVFVFLYCAAIALCQRLHLGTLNELSPIALDVCRVLGLALVIGGCALAIRAVLSSFWNPVRNKELARFTSIFRLRHPIFFGSLIVLSGLPLSFSTWLPLLAIPGMFIGLKWYLRYAESSLLEKFGDEYSRYQAETWFLLPYVRN